MHSSMASSRRASNGRSPLVNPQRQITSFFSPRDKTTASPSSISSKQNPSPRSSSTPCPLQSKNKKPVFVIGPTPERVSSPIQCSEAMLKTPESAKESYREEVVGKRIKVYWPMDECWYEGYVKSFDSFSGKHLVQYDDAEEETLELGKENIELVEDAANSFRRLKRKSSAPEDGKGFQLRKRSVSKAMVVEEKEEEDMEEGSEGDDSEDEDWGTKEEKDNVDEDSEEVDLDEEEEEDDRVRSSKQTKGKNSEAKKRKFLGGHGKKSKFKISPGGDAGELIEPVNNVERVCSIRSLDNILSGDVAERFGIREAKKLWFLGVKERRDAKRRRPGDVDYDPRTLYLPPDFLKSLSGGQRQWWEFKSKHMDKVLFFKMGKFYELFEMDAHIGARELSLQYMKGEQPHCGFPEKNFSMNIEKLARKGFRVLVVEQTETPEQLEARRKVNGSRDKVVKREICAVVTKGTLTEGEVLASCPDASYLFAVTESSELVEDQLVVGVCVIDASTSKFMLGQFGDDSERSTLCSLLSELRPVEIIKPAGLLGPESERALQRHTRSPLVNDLVPVLEFWDAGRTVDEVRKFYGLLKDRNGDPDASNIINGSECLPDVLSELVNMGKHGTAALSAFGGCLFYLRQALLDETLLRYAKFELLPCSGFRDVPQKPYLVLDSAAIENLEIFENNTNGSSTGTLYEQLNHCVTAFGKRLLKNWLARPLYHHVSIRERQEAVAALRGDALPAVMDFRKELLRLPDMERLLARLFASSEANGRNAHKVVLYEDAAKKHLQEFITALRGCQLMARACSSVRAVLNNVDSRLLHRLLTPGQGLPDIDSVLNYFKDAFDWTEADNSGRIIPREGVDAGYDSACKTVKQVESRLGKHLKEQRKVLGDPSINYVTVGKELYLLEVPEGLCGSIPQDYELRSSKKGFFRYWTPEIKELLAECSKAEAEREASLKSILQRMIGCFCEHHIQWRQLVSATADLDALISLAIASDYYEGPSCCPTILDSSCSIKVPSLLAKGLGHPVLKSDALGRGTFVPNDVCVGGMGKANFILLTGPNMGGKSTLLRQVCLAVILAQLGANVPAEQFELSPVDRIFVRMGARDHIMAGQSTFLTELSETASMLSSATRNSLVSLDELGRGTSTSDGQAIAESVLEHLVHKVNCRGMFSSHYHRLSVEYQNDSQVSLCHMACQVGKGKGGVEEVTFLYRLTPGACPKSYGVNVARLAGIPESILEKAAAKSREFEAGYGTYREGSKVKLPDFSEDEKFTVIFRDVGCILSNSSLHETSVSSKIRLLTEIQNRARLLLQES